MEKNLLKSALSGVSAVLMMLAMTACNGNSQTGASTTTTTTYTLTNGVCYVTGTSTAVSSSYCGTTTTTTTGYTLTNGVCYVTGTTTVVSNSYCSTTTSGSICLGSYYQPGYGWGVCNGSNCHGMYLYNTAGTLVYCP